jgi:hypothetical protein
MDVATLMLFGDFDPDDAYDRAAADPQQVAAKLARLYDRLGDGNHDAVARALLAWMIRQGSAR